MPTKDKPETPAEEFIRIRRMQYAEMYPTDTHFMLRLLSTDDDNWNASGLIYCTYNERPPGNALTEEGWKSAKNVSYCPKHWPEPNSHSPLLNIPDNAHDSWLHEISMFCYHVERWNPDDVKQLIQVHTRLKGIGLMYQKDEIARNILGHTKVWDAVKDSIKPRVAFIQALKAQSSRPAPQMKVEPGAKVRFHTGVAESIVLSVELVPGSRFNDTDSARVAILESPLNGTTVHFVENLVATTFPPEK